MLEAAIACLGPLAERGRELGVTVALETHDAFAGSTVVAQVLAQVPGAGAGALWDTLHPYRTGEPVATTIGHLADRLVHVHIKDGRPPQDGSKHCSARAMCRSVTFSPRAARRTTPVGWQQNGKRNGIPILPSRR